MRRKKAEPEEKPKARDVVIPHDVFNEQVLIGAACANEETFADIVRRVPSDRMHVQEHRVIWQGFEELVRRGLKYDPASLKLTAPDVDLKLLGQIEESRPDRAPNLEMHIDAVHWDHKRISAAEGPLASLIDLLRDHRADRSEIKRLARAVSSTFENADHEFLLDPYALVEDTMIDLRRRAEGVGIHPFGIKGLDEYEDGTPRLIPGAEPGLVTVLVGSQGSGKTTVAAHLTLGLARQGKRVTYGAWEVKANLTLQLLATLSLGWSRTKVLTGDLSPEELETIEKRMLTISKRVRFVKNPFQRERSRGKRIYNDDNLDLVQDFIETTGCDVFVADLWQRCLTQKSPEEEESALFRQQAMADKTKCHCILIHQLKTKELEEREDKRPTRTTIKGTSAWVDIADNIFGTHRRALWKNVADDTLELIGLKQRWGKWPFSVEFDWVPETGQISNGRSIKYLQPGTSSELDAEIGVSKPRSSKPKQRKVF